MQNVKKALETGVRYIEIAENRAGQRLDNFLVTQLKGLPKSRIYRLLRKGEVRVNRGRVGPDYRLEAGDSIRLPPIRLAQPKPTPETADFQWLAERVLHEDDVLLALDKPAGLAVHAGTGVSTGVIEALRALRPQAPMLELVHRLDRDTSGCLLIAKDRRTLLALHAQLRAGRIEKRYVALVRGHWPAKLREVSAPLERGRVRGGEQMVGVTADGREAVTRFAVRERFEGATLVGIQLLTGRTHQARVHTAHVGHPIAGDDKYGVREFNRETRALGLRRLFLHAEQLHLEHPSGGPPIRFKAPIPIELTQFLAQLRESS